MCNWKDVITVYDAGLPVKVIDVVIVTTIIGRYPARLNLKNDKPCFSGLAGLGRKNRNTLRQLIFSFFLLIYSRVSVRMPPRLPHVQARRMRIVTRRVIQVVSKSIDLHHRKLKENFHGHARDTWQTYAETASALPLA